MTNKELIQFCADKGVPLPETCQKLDWKDESGFYWKKITDHETWYNLYYHNGRESIFIGGDGVFREIGAKIVHYDAPQMQEIAPLLPVKLRLNTGYDYDGNDTYSNFEFKIRNYPNWHIFYDGETSYADYYVKDFKFGTENHHYAQAYAQLYIALREAGIITA